MGYKQADFVRAYYAVLTEGLTVTKAALNHSIPRKTLEYYVKGKATIESYHKMGLPPPDEVLASFGASGAGLSIAWAGGSDQRVAGAPSPLLPAPTD